MPLLVNSSFSYIDLLLLLGLVQGMLLIFWLSNLKKKGAPGNAILIFLLSTAVVVLLGRMLHYRVHDNWYFYLACFIDTSIFMFGPLGYWFLNGLLVKKQTKQKLLPHLLPAALHLLYAFWFLFQSPTEIKSLYQSGTLLAIFFVMELLGIISFSIYNFLAFRSWTSYQKQVKHDISYDQTIGKFVLGFLVFWAIFNLLWILQFVANNALHNWLLDLNYQWPKLFSYVNIWIVICLAIYALAYAGLRLPEVFRISSSNLKRKKKPRLSQDDIYAYMEKLEELMEKEKMYLDTELSLQKLAEKLGTSTNSLSWLLNGMFRRSFYDYVNGYRVREVIARIKKGDHLSITLLALAYEAGFKSKSTFNKVFKSETGMSPSAYAKTLKN